jgi:hypothetical protein
VLWPPAQWPGLRPMLLYREEFLLNAYVTPLRCLRLPVVRGMLCSRTKPWAAAATIRILIAFLNVPYTEGGYYLSILTFLNLGAHVAPV